MHAPLNFFFEKSVRTIWKFNTRLMVWSLDGQHIMTIVQYLTDKDISWKVMQVGHMW